MARALKLAGQERSSRAIALDHREHFHQRRSEFARLRSFHWFGLIAPRGVPQDMVTKLNSEVRRALALKEVQDGLTLQGFEPTASTPEQFSALIAAESVKWLRAIKESGAKLD
jgi:tripartite-type tricarboxylate transporter receptor subunit TctC